MSAVLEALIARLEAVDLAAAYTDPECLERAIKTRESAVADLQSFDMSTVTEGERARLKPRLLRVIERDQGVLARVEEARRETSLGLSHLVSGRAVVRGYGAAAGNTGAGTRRIG
jgi:hypothetical protein